MTSTDVMPDRASAIGERLKRLAELYSIPYRADAPPRAGRFRTPDGLAISYLDWGGSGSPFLLLHGGSLTAHTFDLVCLALYEQFRCVALDLRGHGMSDWTDDYTIDAYVRDVVAAIDHFGWNDLHIAGMSLGGLIGAHYAARHDTRARSLVMIDVGPEVDFESTARIRTFMDRTIANLTLDQLVDAAVAVGARGERDKLRYRYLHMTKIDADRRLQWRVDRRKPHDYEHILIKLAELKTLAPQISARTLVVRGGESRVLSDARTDAFVRLIPQGIRVTVPNAAHNVQEDNPVALAAAMQEFLR